MRGVWLLVVGFVVLGRQAVAASPDPAILIRFDMSAQPITQALDEYSALTGLEVYYDGSLAASRRSSAVHGVLESDAALRELLAGTGLTARATGKNSFTLVSITTAQVAGEVYRSYFSSIQTKVAQALCARTEMRSVDADVIIRLWVETSGTVRKVELAGVSGAPTDHSQDLGAGLRGLSIGTPPTGMPQPVVMAMLAGEPLGCMRATPEAR